MFSKEQRKKNLSSNCACFLYADDGGKELKFLIDLSETTNEVKILNDHLAVPSNIYCLIESSECGESFFPRKTNFFRDIFLYHWIQFSIIFEGDGQ